MKDLNDIEAILKETKPPDHDVSHFRTETWHAIIDAQRDRHKKGFLSKCSPWIWALASILLILLCIFFMIMLAKMNWTDL